jgi:hypothetical protein
MKIEVLYFEGCPNHVPATEAVRRVLAREGIEAQIVSLDVRDVETATKLRSNSTEKGNPPVGGFPFSVSSVGPSCPTSPASSASWDSLARSSP